MSTNSSFSHSVAMRNIGFSLFFLVSVSAFAQNDSLRSRIHLEINSSPQGAEAYLDGVSEGITPLVIDTVIEHPQKLELRLEEYEPWTFMLTQHPSTTLRLDPTLTPKYGHLEITNRSPTAVLFVDGIQMGEGAFISGRLSGGKHIVEVHQPDASRSARSEITITTGQTIQAFTDMDYFTLRFCAYSVLVPGLGQFADGSHLVGTGFFVATVSAFYAIVYWDDEYTHRYNAYTVTLGKYLSATNVSEASALGARLQDNHNAIDQAKRNRKTASIVAFALHGLNLLDVICFHTTTSSLDIQPPQNSKGVHPTLSFANHSITLGAQFHF